MRSRGAFGSRQRKLPTHLTRSILQRLMLLAVGDQARFGAPKSKHAMRQGHATLSRELLSYVGRAWIRIKPDVQAAAVPLLICDDS